MRIISPLLCILFCVLCLAEDLSNPEEKPVLPDLRAIRVAGPYCGIYLLVAIHWVAYLGVDGGLLIQVSTIQIAVCLEKNKKNS